MLSIFLTVAVKVVSRRDNFLAIEREDFAIGFDLIVTSLILIVAYGTRTACLLGNKLTEEEMSSLKNKFEYLPWVILLYVIALWALSTVVRVKGWENNQRTMHKFWGVAFPTILGVIALLTTVKYFK